MFRLGDEAIGQWIVVRAGRRELYRERRAGSRGQGRVGENRGMILGAVDMEGAHERAAGRTVAVAIKRIAGRVEQAVIGADREPVVAVRERTVDQIEGDGGRSGHVSRRNRDGDIVGCAELTVGTRFAELIVAGSARSIDRALR